jgi:hypothetical protein
VNVSLGNSPVSNCLLGDKNRDGRITIDEINTAVGEALNGCLLAPHVTVQSGGQAVAGNVTAGGSVL